MKPLTDLKPRECRWPVESKDKDHLFCGEPASEGPYCACHRRLAYKPGSAMKLSAGALDRLSDALDGRRYQRRSPTRVCDISDTAELIAQRTTKRNGILSASPAPDTAAKAARLPASKPLGFRPNPRRFNQTEVAR